MLWHHFTVVESPATRTTEILKRLGNLFWVGYQWVRSAVLFLPVTEGRQVGEPLQIGYSTLFTDSLAFPLP